MNICKLIFFFSLFIIYYIYIGYPILIFLLGNMSKRKVKKDLSNKPVVSILIAAFNEADDIEKTIKNKLELDYPVEKYEIIVVSDESTDGTDKIVAKFSDENVRLIRQAPRAGKTSALNLAVPQAKGEIIVFSDANSIYDAKALKKLVQNFADKQVGYVTGKMIYVNNDGSIIGDGCSAYMKYENIFRKYETKVGSIVGVDGGIDAVRKELYEQMNPDQLPDFVLPLQIIRQGYRVVYEPAALIQESALEQVRDEYRMRVRVALRALWALWDMRQLLSIKKYGIYAWQLWSHKILRYNCFVFLLIAYFTNLQLVAVSVTYNLFFLLQNVLYVTAIITPSLKKCGYSNPLSTFIYYFALINVACAHAFFKFVCGKKQVLWTPRTG